MLTNEERQNRIEKYAKVVANIGVRVQKGEEVWVYAGLDQPEFVYMVVEECYKAGAKHVEVVFSYDALAKLTTKYETVNSLARISPHRKAKLRYQSTKLPSLIYIDSDDPDGLKGVDQMKLAKARQKSYPIIKPFRDKMEDKYKWLIVGVPSKAWAEKVFPNLKGEEAINALWDAILLTSRIDENDAVENWNNHNNTLHEKQKKLIEMDLRRLKYKASNGTDFEVELIPGTLWGSASEKLKDGREFNPNIPTEEVFTSPYAGRCNGNSLLLNHYHIWVN